MKMVEVKAKARLLGITSPPQKKGDLIRLIQTAEGNFDCFATAKEYCDQRDCCFKEDCLSSINPRRGGDL